MYKIKNKYLAVCVLLALSILMLTLGFVPSNHSNLEFIGKISNSQDQRLYLPFVGPSKEDSAIQGVISSLSHKAVITKDNNSVLQFSDSGISFFGVELASSPNFQEYEDLSFVEKISKKSQLCVWTKPKTARKEIHLQPRSMFERSKSYNELVNKYSQQYGLSPELVLAIMQVESGFNPNLVSSRQAHGLMQVVPGTAGSDVHKYFGKKGLPSSESLLDPNTNIKYGTAYLSLLNKHYFSGIANKESQEYCMIAAYNLGPNALLSSFAPKQEDAIAMINALSPEELLAELQIRIKALETRQFITKVLNAKTQYDSLG